MKQMAKDKNMNSATSVHHSTLFVLAISYLCFFSIAVLFSNYFIGGSLAYFELIKVKTVFAAGTTYYFSDCATGGSGTQASPYCLDVDNNGVRESIMYLFDGAGLEAATGDTINLCAGACDGSGSATYRPNRTGGNAYWFCSAVSGNSSASITIQNYPGEKITISGDSNGDNIYDGGDVDNIITNACRTGIEYIKWKGNDVSGSKGFILEKSGGRMVTLDTADVTGSPLYYFGGPNGWVFDGLLMRYSGGPMWSGISSLPVSFYASGCSVYDVGSAMIKVMGLTGPFTVQNSILHSVCGFTHRNTNNDGGGAFLFQNNEYYNSASISADFYNIRSDNLTGASFVWRNNYIHDAYVGIVVKDRTRNVVIEDNTITCLGEYKLYSDGRCGAAIVIDESTSGEYTGTTYNVTIRRNRAYSVATTPSFSAATCPSSSCGWFLMGIVWRTTCDPAKGYCTYSNGLIENNMVWNHMTATGGDCEKGGICVTSNNNGITVRGNTIYGGSRGVSLLGTGNIDYSVYDNLVVNTSNEALWANSGVAPAKITYNNLYKSSGIVASLYGGSSTYDCLTISGLNTGNKCMATSFLNTSGSVSTWNLHLPATDTANINAGTAGSTDDIDKQSRPQGIAWDIGADEQATVGNISPTANAGTDRSGKVGYRIALVGSGIDTDGTVVSYLWSISPSSGCTLSGQTTTRLVLLCSVQGTFTVTLTVTDNQGATGSDTAILTTAFSC